MATANPFDLLEDNDNDDPSQLIIAAQKQQQQPPQKAAPPKKAAAPAAQPVQAKMPSKPLPPAQAVRESKNEMGSGRGGRSGGGRGLGRGRGSGFYRESNNNDSSFDSGVAGGYGAVEDGEAGKRLERGRGSYVGPRGRGGRRGGLNDGEVTEGGRPRRQFERRSGTGRGNEIKRDGAGQGNWGTPADEIVQETEEAVDANEKTPEKQPGEEDAAGANKESTVNEPPEEKEPEEKEMTLDEYEKILEEKRKALQALKTEERKVDFDKDFQSMQQLSSKKDNDDIFIKLSSEKDKRKEIAEKEDRAKKSVSINEFLKPAEGTRYYGGRGRGRGNRASRGGFAGGNMVNSMAAPSIEDQLQFPILGAN